MPARENRSTSNPRIKVVEDPIPVFTDELLTAIRSGGHVALTGGSTPKRAYEMAAQQPDVFARARLWFGDERCVAPDDERSNYGMAKTAMLDPVAEAGIKIAFCRRMLGELGPDEAAARYERALIEEDAGRFALVVLGIGSDGHIASMFPGQTSLLESERLVVGVPEAGLEPFVPRVTLTFAALARADRVLVLATSAGKAEAVSAAFSPDASLTHEVPASLLASHVNALTVLLDPAAAERL